LTRILFIEDDPDRIKLTLPRLSLWGYQAQATQSGSEALVLHTQQPYDVVIIDYHMPEMNGLQVLDQLQQGPFPPDCIMVTAYGDEKIAVQAMQQGAADYIVRDHRTEESEALQASLERVLERRALKAQKHQAQAELDQFFDLSPHLLLILGWQGQIMRVNSALSHLLGHTSDEFYSKALMEWLHPQDAPRMKAKLAEFQAYHNGPMTYEGRLLHQNGEYRWFSFTLSGDLERQRIYCIAQDVTEQKQRVDILHRSEAHYRNLLERMQEGLLVRDADGRITYTNPHFSQMLGYSAEELLQQPIGVLVAPEDQEKVKHHSDKRKRGESSTYEANLETKSGKLLRVLISGSPLYDDKDQFIGSFAVVTDLTDRYHIERRTLELAIERERVSILSKFITNASHEFKTPLSIIQTSLYLLEKVRDLDKQGRYIGNIKNQAEALLTLVEDLATMLELDSLESIPTVPIDLNIMLPQLLDSLLSTCKAHQVSLTYHLDPLLSSITAHPGWLNRALSEVLDNAIRYNVPNGSIHVSSLVLNKQLVIQVEDSGQGIPPKLLPLVLERFFRQDQAHSTRGFGLGLPIAQRIMELHQGRLEITSPIEPQGTRVQLCFPIWSSKERLTASEP
jgi:PAS domain S-box-containing protein